MRIVPGLATLFLALPALTQQAQPPATDADRARWTMSDMRSLATAVEAFAVDHNEYPKGTTLDAIAAAIEPVYIRKAPRRDAWGYPYLYECKDGRSYTIVSVGADGTRDQGSSAPTAAANSYAADAVFADGQFVRSWAYR